MRVRLRLGWVADIDPEKDCEAILNCTLDTALSISHAEMGNIQLLDGGRRDLEIRAQRGFKAPFLDFFGSLNTERTACSFALREARPITVEDITNSPIFKGTQGMEVLLEAEVRAVLSTPLIGSTGQVLGVLSVHYRQPRLYWNDETVRLSILARTAARLIEGGMGKSS
ncbi:MAG: GAF domain-containing protein [Thermodesulfobacteriota bacterium]